MREKEAVTFTNMCMVYEGGKVVVINRVNKSWGGIAFPGGHVEKGESFTDAVIREVYEETGLTIEAPTLCGICDWPTDDGGRYVILLYKANKFSGELTSSDEGEVFWADVDSLPKMPLANDMDVLLRVFSDDDLSEFFYYRDGGEWKHELK